MGKKNADELYLAIGTDLAVRGAESGKMFGMPTLKVNGKAFAGLWQDQMIFKLIGAAHAKALGLKGAQLFDPSGMLRPMKEWVIVPAAHSKQWLMLAEAALEYVKKQSK